VLFQRESRKWEEAEEAEKAEKAEAQRQQEPRRGAEEEGQLNDAVPKTQWVCVRGAEAKVATF
jgi:hypothetical protein